MKSAAISLGPALFAGALIAAAAGGPPASAPATSTRPSATATAPTSGSAYEAFGDLPDPMTRPAGKGAAANTGTPGLALPALPPPAGAGATIAILGDLAPESPAVRERLMRQAVGEINLLRPDAVLTLGNLVPGLTRNGADYVEQVRHTRNVLDELNAPWFPCAGMTDTFSGTREPGDRRFEDLYQRYVGPLYFSADIGGGETGPAGSGVGRLHVIVLDSQEVVPASPAAPASATGIGDAQLQWLIADLNQTFQQGRSQGIIVLLHQPLWQTAPDNWRRVHEQLLTINRRPTAVFEGSGGALAGPKSRVLAVLAAGSAYSQEPARDGIHYYTLGPTAGIARPAQGPEALRHFTLVKLDATGTLHTALIRLAADDPNAAAILPEDIVTADERRIIDGVASWDDKAFGIDGVVDERGNAQGHSLALHLANPLPEAFDVQLRLAPGGSWDFVTVPATRHLTAAAGTAATFSADVALRRIRAGIDLPVMQAQIRWADSRGRVHEVILSRPVPVAPSLDISVADKPLPLNDPNWPASSASSASSALAGTATAWHDQPDAPRKADPTIALRADADRVFVQVHVSDATPSYWPAMKLDPAWGGLASDAVSLSWAKSDHQVHRLWVLPFAAVPQTRPAKPALWINTGLGDAQTPLTPADPKFGIDVSVRPEPGGYSVTFSLPRKTICDEFAAPPAPTGLPLLTPPPAPTYLAATTLLNVSVHDNDHSARTWTKSWALDDAGPDAWAHIQLIQTNPQGGHAP